MAEFLHEVGAFVREFGVATSVLLFVLWSLFRRQSTMDSNFTTFLRGLQGTNETLTELLQGQVQAVSNLGDEAKKTAEAATKTNQILSEVNEAIREVGSDLNRVCKAQCPAEYMRHIGEAKGIKPEIIEEVIKRKGLT